MKLYDYLQVNSNFFYTKKFTNLNLNKYLSFDVNVKNLDQNKLNELLQSIAFNIDDSTVCTLIQTNQGEFLIQSISNEHSDKKIMELLKDNSINGVCYYFHNVDYFTFGKFGIGENGKVSRFLVFNSEAKNDEPVVTWIGKPHKWEYETHTFYSKQKLEDFEMEFDSDTVCEMIDFYIPFANDDFTINSITVYSIEEQTIESVKNLLSDNPLLLTNFEVTKVTEHLTSINAFPCVIKVYKYKDKLMFSNNITSAKQISTNNLDTLVAFSKKVLTIKTHDFTQRKFEKIFTDFFKDLANTSVHQIREVIEDITEVDDTKNYREINITFNISNNKKVMNLYLDTGRHYLQKFNFKFSFLRKNIAFGNTLNRKTIYTLYKKITKLKVL